jgi:TatD DNase family protein
MAEKAMNLGFYISFSGIVTFKNAIQLQEVSQHVPLERILIETDTPYLTPHPHRGKPNDPSYVRFVAAKIAELRGISFEEVAEQTTKNFFKLFRSSHESS